MFLEQKPKLLASALPKLFLAAVILICFSVVLGVAGYLVTNKQVVNLQPQISASPQPTFSPIVKDETSDWQICKNEKYGYEIKYPLGWKVWLPGAPEARLANCEENLSLIAFSPNIYAFPNQQQIYIDIYDQDRSKGTEWEGVTSLDDYLKIVPVEINKETIIDGKRFVWSGVDNNQLTAFYNGSIYYFNVYNIEDSLLDQILSTFKFTGKDLSFSCGTSTVADIDNNIYKTVQIGSQCWLKENLKVTKNPEGKAITRYCYNNDPKICETDGGLYDWNTAMNNLTAEGAQGICPTSWHIPKDSEWFVLENGFMGNKTEQGIYKDDKNFTAFNVYGTSSPGFRDNTGTMVESPLDILFWSSSDNKIGTINVFDVGFSAHGTIYAGQASQYKKTTSLSIRCLKD